LAGEHDKSWEFDDYEDEIKTLKDMSEVFEKKGDLVEEIDLRCNEIIDPNDITKILMSLPNLKGLWLTGNPVADNCANF
jgi:hypothetical protein